MSSGYYLLYSERFEDYHGKGAGGHILDVGGLGTKSLDRAAESAPEMRDGDANADRPHSLGRQEDYFGAGAAVAIGHLGRVLEITGHADGMASADECLHEAESLNLSTPGHQAWYADEDSHKLYIQ